MRTASRAAWTDVHDRSGFEFQSLRAGSRAGTENQLMKAEYIPVRRNDAGVKVATPAADSRSRASRLVLDAARCGLLSTLAYATWHYGATDPIAWVRVSYGLLAVFVLVLVAVALGWRPLMRSYGLALTSLLFIAYAVVQTIDFGDWIAGAHVTAIRSEFATAPANALRHAADQLTKLLPAPAPAQTISIIPQFTRIALVPYLLATAIGLLAMHLFTDTRAWKQLLWFTLLNLVALAVWGLIQRSTGSRDLLPGIVNSTWSMPFATFVYRNAGAAALLPGVAAAVTLYLGLEATTRQAARLRRTQTGFSYDGPTSGSAHSAYEADARFLKPNHDHRSSRPHRSENARGDDRGTRFFSVRELVLITLGCFVGVGVVAALSRGAWIAAIVGLVGALLVQRAEIRWTRGLTLLAMFALLSVFTTWHFAEQIEARWQRVSYEGIAKDGRWEHWKVGLAAAVDFFPLGSGLGTYGYAALLNQAQPSSHWFREAHNEYLDLLVEFGFVGCLLLASLLFITIRRIRLLLSLKSTEVGRMGVFFLMLLLFAACQSIADFVITVPANLFAYACFTGTLFAVTVPYRRSVTESSGPLVSIATVLTLATIPVLLVASLRTADAEHAGNLVLASSSVSDLSDQPEEPWAQDRIRALDAAIRRQPDRAALHKSRALHELALYRLEILREAERTGEELDWESTQPEAVFAVLVSLPQATRDATLTSLTHSAGQKARLENSLRSLAQAIESNPLVPQVHLIGATLTPFTKTPTKSWLDHAQRLSLSDPDKLFQTGFFAFQTGDEALMCDAWRDCLSVTQKYERWIVDMALRRMTVLEVAERLSPQSNPQMLIALIRAVLTALPATNPPVGEDVRKIGSELAEIVNQNDSLADETRSVIVAQIYAIAGMDEDSADAWLAAVKSNPKRPEHRFEAARLLRRTQHLDEALHQAVIGRSLSLDSGPFDKLIAEIRQDISRQSSIPRRAD